MTTTPPAAGTGTSFATTTAPVAPNTGGNGAQTTIPTSGTSTSFDGAQATGGGYKQVPHPSDCPGMIPRPTPSDVGGKNGFPGKQIEGGGLGASSGISQALSSLTSVIEMLKSAVAGMNGSGANAAGGGAPGKAPEPNKGPSGKDQQGKGPETGVAGQNGAPDKGHDASNCPHQMGGVTQGGGSSAAPDPSTVAGQQGAGSANAAAGAANVQGGGAPAGDMSALVAALQGVIQALNALIQALSSQNTVTQGGGPGKPDPGQKGTTPNVPPPSGVDGANGKPDQNFNPTQQTTPPPAVGGSNGGTKPDPTQNFMQKGTTPIVPPPAVGGSNGGTKPDPTQNFMQKGTTPIVPPPAVDGANGKPDQNFNPTQQTTPPPKKPEVGGVYEGTVKLINDDSNWEANLQTSDGKNGVKMWGDPHIVLTKDGKVDGFDIGYGPGKITLFDGTVVSWHTYDLDEKHPNKGQGWKPDDGVMYLLEDFRVDSPGTEFDRFVTTRDRNGADHKAGNQTLNTALSEAHLDELGIALSTMKGPMSEPLKNGTWVSPLYKEPRPDQNGK